MGALGTMPALVLVLTFLFAPVAGAPRQVLVDLKINTIYQNLIQKILTKNTHAEDKGRNDFRSQRSTRTRTGSRPSQPACASSTRSIGNREPNRAQSMATYTP
jgi:hypothetical protein